MNEQEYNKLIGTLKEKYLLEREIVKNYTFMIKDKEYKTILGYFVRERAIGLCGLLVIFQDDTIYLDSGSTCFFQFNPTPIFCFSSFSNLWSHV